MAKARVRRVYVKARRKGHKPKFTLPVAALAGFAPLVKGAYDGYQSGGFNGALAEVSVATTGYNPIYHNWNLTWALKRGWLPIIAGIAVHKFVGGRLGVNKMLARAGVPIIRL